jgi:hypothetical protein
MQPNFDWRDALEQLFAATLNQEPLEDASQIMASVSSRDPEYHVECLFLFEKGKELAQSSDISIINYINKSGYKISSFDEAHDLIEDFESEYTKSYNAQISV